MVMKKNAMRKNLRQSILKSLGRYVAIVAIIALGAGMFVGLLMTKADMVATGQVYMDEQNMFDLRLMTDYGWNPDQVELVSQMDGVVDAEGVVYTDVIATVNDQTDEKVYRFYAMPEEINRLVLRGGRMPEKRNECVIDGFHLDDEILGTTLTVAATNSETTMDAMVCNTYTIVGYVSSPLNMDTNRGSTSVGSGNLENIVYIPADGMDVDYVTEINITVEGDYAVYTDAYHDAMDAMAEQLEPLLEPLAQARLDQVREDALQAYNDGMLEYFEGVKEFNEGKAEALQELADAHQKLQNGEQEIADNEQLLLDGEKQIAEAWITLKEGEKTLQDSKKTLATTKASSYKQISDSTQSLLREFESISTGITTMQNDLTVLQTESLALNTSILQLETDLSLIDSQISMSQSMIGILDSSIETSYQALEMARENGAAPETLAALEEELRNFEASKAEYTDKLARQQAKRAEVEAQLAPLYARQKELDAQQKALNDQISLMEKSMTTMTEGLLTLVSMQSVMDAEFAAADAQIEAGEAQMEAGKLELELREQEIIDGKAQLEEAKAELADGWREYYKGKAEAEQKLSDAEAELADGQQKLADALDTIQAMTENRTFLLSRTSNLGYNSLESSSDIVQGVSRVFPAFFLLIASLVCITTMTRMIDEERTQIGTLKALGYSNWAIISKYLFYAGSGAVVGCGLGVLAGSMAFPVILWEAYKNMLYMEPVIVLKFNWLLCGIVVVSYTGVMLLVTWYCCRRALQDVPAELIRPKSPDAGKKILLEYLPFWKKISFLNKVTIRNIFRYRQRLAMMMVGIGGCTALLLTGYGLRDSIVNIVDYQFSEVTQYDLQVYFNEGQTAQEQEIFLKDSADCAEEVLFYHQESAELEFDDQVREVYLMVADSRIQDFVDFHSGGVPLSMPADDEVYLTVGVARNMGIDLGDRILLRNTDMETLTLTVSGIYDNHINNFAIVTPGAVAQQWGREADDQMALIRVDRDKIDIHAASAQIAGLDGVMNVSVSADMADMVTAMMDALDSVVWVVVLCAGLLAVIVLYNLTNININERIREIATIKVLGFNAMETASYVFKENMALTVMGSLVGLPLGYLLLVFVMSQIKIDFCWFNARVTWLSYVLSVALTLLSSVVVDVIFYHKLDRINMAEALKSVE